MATITKRDLVISLSNETGLTQREVFSVIQGLIDSVTASLAQNDEVVLRNFGTFLVKETKAKIGRNPNRPEKDVKILALDCRMKVMNHHQVTTQSASLDKTLEERSLKINLCALYPIDSDVWKSHFPADLERSDAQSDLQNVLPNMKDADYRNTSELYNRLLERSRSEGDFDLCKRVSP